MSQSHDEYGDRLRRALRAEAETVVPSPDGLERIRFKIEQRRRRAWLPRWLPADERSWMRPAAALGGALVLTGVVVVSVPSLREQLPPGFPVSGWEKSREPALFETRSPEENLLPPFPVLPPTPNPTGTDMSATYAPFPLPSGAPCPTPTGSPAPGSPTPSPTPASTCPPGSGQSPTPMPSNTGSCPSEGCPDPTPSPDASSPMRDEAPSPTPMSVEAPSPTPEP